MLAVAIASLLQISYILGAYDPACTPDPKLSACYAKPE